MKLNETLNQKAYIYSINYHNLPIYIGSTLNINDREKAHNRHLKNTINGKVDGKYLYDYISKNNKILNINKIELKVIKFLMILL